MREYWNQTCILKVKKCKEMCMKKKAIIILIFSILLINVNYAKDYSEQIRENPIAAHFLSYQEFLEYEAR